MRKRISAFIGMTIMVLLLSSCNGSRIGDKSPVDQIASYNHSTEQMETDDKNSIDQASLDNHSTEQVKKKYAYPAVLSIESEAQPVLSFGKHGLEDEYYIKDFCVLSDNSVLLVDSKTGKIFRFGDNELIKIYDFNLEEQDIHPYRIANDSQDNIYLLDGKQNIIMKIDESDNIHYSKFNDFLLTAVSDFYAIDNNIVAFYAINPDIEEGCTFQADISGETSMLKETKIQGRLIDDFVYLPEHIPDEGKLIGHGIKVAIYNFDGSQRHELFYNSDMYVLGAICYGTTSEGYLFKVVEMDEDNAVYEHMVIIDENSSVKARYKLPSESFLSLKSINDTVYQFTQNETTIRLQNILSKLNKIDE